MTSANPPAGPPAGFPRPWEPPTSAGFPRPDGPALAPVTAVPPADPPTVPPAAATPEKAEHIPRPIPPWARRLADWLVNLMRRLGAYGLLAVMAGADAFFFYNTLAGIMQRGIEFLWIFVVALSLGAVLACEFTGRLTRRRRAAHGGSVTWIGVLVLLWFSLGASLAWIRAQTALSADEETDTGVLADSGASRLDYWEQPQVQVAGLMLGLYLLTGVLTMTFGYLFHDPRTDRERELVRLYEDLAFAEKQADVRRRRQQLEEKYGPLGTIRD